MACVCGEVLSTKREKHRGHCNACHRVYRRTGSWRRQCLRCGEPFLLLLGTDHGCDP